jgi:hypothetical protein
VKGEEDVAEKVQKRKTAAMATIAEVQLSDGIVGQDGEARVIGMVSLATGSIREVRFGGEELIWRKVDQRLQKLRTQDGGEL